MNKQLTPPKQRPALRPMTVQQLMEFLNGIPARQRQIEDSKLKIVVLQPGSIGGTPTVDVEQAHFGIDWNARQLMLYPAQPLTRLSAEDVAAIHKSAKEGQSWHAFQQYKKQAERIKALEAEIATLRQVEQEPFATHITTPMFLAALDMDQLYHCQELTKARIDAIKDAGRVTVFEVSDDTTTYFGTDDYPAALNALARISREQFDKTGRPENFELRQRRIYQAELADWLTHWAAQA